MSRVYTVEFDNQPETLAIDWFELTPADDKPIKILSGVINQSTELGDSQEEQMRLRIIRGHTSSGSGGDATTPIPVDPDDPAAGFTCETNNTTIASGGTPVNVHSEAWNNRSGFIFVPIPDAKIKCTQAQTLLVVRLLNAPLDSVSWTGTLYVIEL